jgi:serine/threonine-protein kinase
MGIVYLARDLALDRPVAVKMLPPLSALAVVGRERFIREARITASLSHPNIVPIHTFEVTNDCAFFVMAFVDGETLEERIRRVGPLDAENAIQVLREVAWALDHAHLRGIVHRDVKPGNIILERESGRVLVADFGIAHDQFEAVTQTGRALGTRGFASPEQIGGAEANVRADIYGFGATGWFALTGKPPEPSAQPLRASDLYSVRSDIPLRVADLLVRCVAASPHERPASASELAQSVNRSLDRAALIPGPVERWIRTGESLVIPLLFYSLTPFMQLGWPWMIRRDPERFLIWHGLPWLAFALYRLGSLERLVRQGYGILDIRSSLDNWRRRRHQAVMLTNRKVPAGLSRMVRWGTVAALGLALIGTSTPLLRPWPAPRMWWVPTRQSLYVFAFNLTLVAGVVGWIWPRWARPATDYLADARVRFWGSRWGDWLTSGAMLIARLVRRKEPLAFPQLRHTEVALLAGVAELFAELQPALQDRVEAVPALAAELERQAREIRGAIGVMADLETSALPHSSGTENSERNEVYQDLLARRARLEERHRQVINALESLRLGLMRLVARGEMPLECSETLEEAHELTHLLGLLHQAQQTVEESADLIF